MEDVEEEEVPKHSWSRRAALLALVALGALLGGCAFDGPQSTLVPVGELAKDQLGLLEYTTWWSVVVMLGVGGVLIYAIVRFRQKPGDDTLPAQTHGNAVIEVGLILVAVIITVAVAVPSVATELRNGARMEVGEGDVAVNVTGYQWWWKFEYPDEGIITANELHVPQGSRLILNLSSADVLHSFWAPKLSGKRDLIPNQDNQLWITTEGVEPGVYYGQCAELCLGAHAYMRFRVIIDTPEQYAAWLESFQSLPELGAGQPAVQTVQADPLAAQGATLFKQKGCAACHAIRGVSSGAPDKPNLTNFGLRTTVAAGVLDNTPENLARWLRDPQEVKPTNRMPTLWSADDPNRDSEIEAIVAYLESLGRESAPQAQAQGGAYGN
jgi:cytochrome c oxidase subunit 2